MLKFYFCLLLSSFSFSCYASGQQETLSTEEAGYKQALQGKDNEYQQYYNKARNEYLAQYYKTGLEQKYENYANNSGDYRAQNFTIDPTDYQLYKMRKDFMDTCTKLLGEDKRYQFLCFCMQDKCVNDHIMEVAQRIENARIEKEQAEAAKKRSKKSNCIIS